MPLEPIISRDLTIIINGAGSPFELLSVANIHVLFFRDDIQSPSYGYQPLILLSSVSVEKGVPLLADMLLNQEILAAHPDENHITEYFLCLWGPCGVKAENYFIIIFTGMSTQTPNLSCHGSPFTHIQSTSTSRSCHSPVGFQSPSPIGVLTSLHGLGNASSDTSRMGSPMVEMAINWQLSNSLLVHSTPFLQDNVGDHCWVLVLKLFVIHMVSLMKPYKLQSTNQQRRQF